MPAFTVYEDEGLLALVVAPDEDVARRLAADHIGGIEPEELWSLNVAEVEPLLGDTLVEEPARVIEDDRDHWRHGIYEEGERICAECGIPQHLLFGVAVCSTCNRCVVTLGGLDFNECGHTTGCAGTVQVSR